MPHRPLKAGSITSRTKEVIGVETERRGRAIDLGETHQAFERRFGSLPRNRISSSISQLVKRGAVTKVNGRLRHTRYALSDNPYPYGDGEDEAGDVLKALQQAVEHHGRATSAGEVREMLPNDVRATSGTERVRHLLNTLAHISPQKRKRAHGAWGDQLVERIGVTATFGKKYVFYAPADGQWDPPTILDSSDAVRRIVALSEEELGRPITKREMELWAQAVVKAADGETSDQSFALATHLQSTDFSSGLNAVAFKSRPRESVWVRQVATPFTSRGAFPARYSAKVDPDDDLCCLLLDLGVLLHPEDELDEIEEGRRNTRSDVAMDIYRAREQALNGLLIDEIRGAAGQDLSTAVARSVERIGRTREVLQAWIGFIPGFPNVRDREVDQLNADLRQVELIQELVRAGSPEGGTKFDAVGPESAVPVYSLEELAREAYAVNQLEVSYWRPIIDDARRVRGQTAGGAATSDDEALASLVDRMDALRVLVQACPLPTIGMMVGSAYNLVGGILRDRDFLRRSLCDTAEWDSETKTALTVALGMMGKPPAVGIACPAPEDPHLATAYASAVSLGVDQEDDRLRLMEDAQRRATGAAATVLRDAVMRLELGERLTVVD